MEFGVDPGPRPDIARVRGGGLGARDCPLLAIVERPNLVALDAFGVHVADQLIMHLCADRARIRQHLRDGVEAHVRRAGDGTHAHAFGEEGENLDAFR